MPENTKRYTITAALPYANGPVHIGHLAGVYVPADIYVRYLRSKGEDVAFVCGSDEHGVPITLRAKAEGISPQEVVDKYDSIIKKSFLDFGISFDIYSRTSSPTHHETAAAFFKNLYDKGVFEEKESMQYYDEESQQFLADRYIVGTCPNCNYDNAYGDQCESCGTSLSPNDLKKPKSALSGNPPIKKSTKHWYLPMNKYEKWLREWILEGHKEWKSNVYGQCKSWLDLGLQPRAMTRDLDWGVRVPIEGEEGKVLYVWFDAPIGYISATKDWAKAQGKDWEPYWKSEDTKLIHFIGKDNIVFHCIIFPTILKADGNYVLPDNVPANEFLNLEGDKISTSRNWAVWLHEYLADFPEKQDVLRYTLCANAPETKDNDFTWKSFQERNNNELVAILGNFINRAVVLTHKYFDGKIPVLGSTYDLDSEVIEKVKAYPRKIAKSLEQYRFREAMTLFMELARVGNKYLGDTEPWILMKDANNRERVATILNLSLQLAANISILGGPFLPFSMDRLSEILNFNEKNWSVAGAVDLLKEGHDLNKAELLFQKIENEEITAQVERLEKIKQENAVKNQKADLAKDTVTFDDFMKMDIRIGTILEAEKVKKSKKLLRLLVDTGIDQRTVMSGIAEYFTPEETIGKQVSILVNLAPRKIMGVESQGMILMAEDKDGSLKFIQPSDNVSPGAGVS